MSEATPTIFIDDKEYEIESLPEAAKVNLVRTEQLQREIAELQMVLEERQLVLQARKNAVIEAVQAAEAQEEPDDADAA